MQEETIVQDAALEKPEGAEPQGDLQPEEKAGKIDPLDEIDDPVVLRTEAKKFRSIANRFSAKNEGTVEPAKAPETIETPGNYVTKKDLEDRNERTALKQFTTITETDTDQVKAMKSAFSENLDEISTYYVNRSGREEPEQIMEDLHDAYLVWARKKGQSVDLSELMSISVVKTGGKPPKTETKTDEDPRFRVKKSPKDWYKK